MPIKVIFFLPFLIFCAKSATHAQSTDAFTYKSKAGDYFFELGYNFTASKTSVYFACENQVVSNKQLAILPNFNFGFSYRVFDDYYLSLKLGFNKYGFNYETTDVLNPIFSDLNLKSKTPVPNIQLGGAKFFSLHKDKIFFGLNPNILLLFTENSGAFQQFSMSEDRFYSVFSEKSWLWGYSIQSSIEYFPIKRISCFLNVGANHVLNQRHVLHSQFLKLDFFDNYKLLVGLKSSPIYANLSVGIRVSLDSGKLIK